jgi:hypothetical protein
MPCGGMRLRLAHSLSAAIDLNAQIWPLSLLNLNMHDL